MAATKIDAAQARNDILAADALLVCAYDDKEKCEKYKLEDAITLDELQAQAEQLEPHREIIFYCDCPHDELSSELAEKYQEQGFSHAKHLEGGFKAWKSQGFPASSKA